MKIHRMTPKNRNPHIVMHSRRLTNASKVFAAVPQTDSNIFYQFNADWLLFVDAIASNDAKPLFHYSQIVWYAQIFPKAYRKRWLHDWNLNNFWILWMEKNSTRKNPAKYFSWSRTVWRPCPLLWCLTTNISTIFLQSCQRKFHNISFFFHFFFW